ncbi:MAG: beta-lactamase family protein [Pseudomonadota bacterium]|nr:beta-lactamase family protein [Pseudomonadota bacterium]
MKEAFASQARNILDATVAAGVPGIVAMARDREGVLFSGAAGLRRLGAPAPMTTDTVFSLFSCTKPLTAAVALRLVEEGRLDLDAPARTYLPALGEIGVFDGYDGAGAPRFRAPKRDITARMLMLHTAGFGYDFANLIIRRLLDEQRLTPHRSATRAGFRQPLVNEPGERWEYGLSIDWLGMVIEAIVGERLDAILHEYVLAPLGMCATAHMPTPDMRARLAAMHQREADGSLTPLDIAPRETLEVVPGGGGLYGEVGDYMRFLGAWLNDGAGVLKPETVAWAARDGLAGLKLPPLPTVAPRVSGPLDFFPGMAKSWAYSFMVNDEDAPTGRPAGSLSWGGLGNLYFWIDRRNGVAGFWATQLFPFMDPVSLGGALKFEAALYEALASPARLRAN